MDDGPVTSEPTEPTPPPPAPPELPRDRAEAAGLRERPGVAILLAVAAVVAAAIAGRASLLSESAFDRLQESVREEVQFGAALAEDIRFVYTNEAPQAFRVARALIRADEFREQARRTRSDRVSAELLVRAQALELTAETVRAGSEVAQDDEYREGDGFDMLARLADTRARNPDLVEIDAEATQGEGVHLGRRAYRMLAASIPVAVAFMFGALAQAFATRRRPLLIGGWVFLGAGLVIAVALEIAGI